MKTRKGSSRRCVSIRMDTYERLRAVADAHGVSISTIVEQAVRNVGAQDEDLIDELGPRAGHAHVQPDH